MRATRVFLTPLLALVLAGCGSADSSNEPVQTIQEKSSVVPVYYPDNPDCSDIGLGPLSYKVEPPASGVFPLDAYGNDVTVTVSGLTFDWSADISIDAVIVKGGDNANVYFYDPEALADTGLHAPMGSSGSWSGLSHMEFCFDYNVDVQKTAVPSFDRTYSWTIDKASLVSSLLLSSGQIINVDYWVDLAATFADKNFAVGGTVTVHNPAPMAANITSIVDMLGGSPVSLSCGVSFPYALAPGGDLSCTYSAAVASATNVLNEVTVNTTGAVGGGSASDLADFGSEAVVTKIDECLTLSDNRYGALGTFCEPGPHHVAYTLAVGPYECGEYDFVNIASFLTNDTSASGSDSWTVHITVPCPQGCSLTPGYWKTHSANGPAPYDDVWAMIGESAPFFLSGQSYYEVLWTAPLGNVYYSLAHAYIAAQLNGLNGADLSAAQAAFDEATVIFQTYTPAQVAAFKGKEGVGMRAMITALSTTLDNYNNGLIGPGHCDE